jgi:6-phosphofructokinase 1
MNNIAVFTSGGDSPGMNACIRAVVRAGLYYGMKVWGIKRGYEGLIDDDFQEMDSRSVGNIIQKGGTILQTARSERFRTPEGRKIAYENLKKRGIEGIVAIGGDGTFTGAKVFMQEYPDIMMVGAPGTIDNDLFGTDFTIGYDTAINTAMEAIDKIKDTATAHNRLFFVEVMGRDAGLIALRSGIATGAEEILVPEVNTRMDDLISSIEEAHLRKKTGCIVVVAEGDDAGGAFKIAEAVKARSSFFEIKVAILGHIQRGGSPSCMDRVLASQLGIECVDALRLGINGVMIGKIHKKIVHTPFERAIKHRDELSPVLLHIATLLNS